MRWLLTVSMLVCRIAVAGLEDYPELLRPRADERAGVGGIRVTYLGVNGYQFEADGHALLVDPYFSRLGLASLALNARVAPDAERLAAGLKHVRRRVDAVVVTHAHIDHLLDVRPIMQRTGARLVAGPTAVKQVCLLGVKPAQCRPVGDGDVRRIGPWTIRVFAAAHDRLFGSVPVPGPRRHPEQPPAMASDWVLGEPLAFIIEAAGQRIFINSGGVPETLPPTMKVDLAILGVALPDSRRAFASEVRNLHPRYTLPSHQDDFFRPFADGFVFGKLTDFPAVLRTWQRERLPGELILLDYFRPWTLR